ncbi:exosortase A [Qipengyuania sp. JC766]|uniref:exosortase A n=1 Tax=Qipengyuania sp. JC766 TaxID=3232139 RepID=UPI003458D847
MPPDAASVPAARLLPRATIAPAWREPLGRLAIAAVLLLALTLRDWLAMFDQWWNVSTYNHVLLVPPIVGWLVWVRRDGLSHLVPKAWWPGLVLLAGALFLWLLGSLAGVNSASQLGAVGALQAAVVTLLGLRVAAALAFPIAYMFFLVPFGDELVPALQMITAELVIALTGWSGIPAQIDGVFIDTPVGLFEVAEACSGVKFLIAMVALGVLVGYTCFRSWKRRALFMLAAVALPILANGVRAWGTIYIAQSQGIEFAVGFDHVFYGWIFFAIVVAALLAIFWRWFDRDPEDVGIDFPRFAKSGGAVFGQLGARPAFLGVLALIAVFGGWHMLGQRIEADLPQTVMLPDVPGWQREQYRPAIAWQPRAAGADHRLVARYRDASGRDVDVFVALYAAQRDGKDPTAYGEGALVLDSPWRWVAPANTGADAVADIYLADGIHRRRAETSYRTGALFTGSAMQMKLAAMKQRLLLRAQPSVMLILSTDGRDDPEAIADFRAAIGDEGAWLDCIVQGR